MFEYPAPKLPDFSYSTSGRYTYVRISVKPPAGSGRERAYKTVGKIDNSTGTGEIVFTEEFLQQYPNLRYFEVRKVDDQYQFELETEGGCENGDLYPLVFKLHPLMEPLRPELSCLSMGYALFCRRLLKEDPLPNILKQCFPHDCNSFLAAACFKALNLISGTPSLDSYAAMAVLPFDEHLTERKWSDLKAGLDDEIIGQFFKQTQPAIDGRVELYLLPPVNGFPFTLAAWFSNDAPLGFKLLNTDELQGSVLTAALDNIRRLLGSDAIAIPTIVAGSELVAGEDSAFRGLNRLVVCDAKEGDFILKDAIPLSVGIEYELSDELKAQIDPDAATAFEAEYTKLPGYPFCAIIMPRGKERYCLLTDEIQQFSLHYFDNYLRLGKLYKDLTVPPTPFCDKKQALTKLKASLFELMLAWHVKSLIEDAYCLYKRCVDIDPDAYPWRSKDEFMQYLHKIKVLTNKENGRKFILPLSDDEENLAVVLGLVLRDSCLSLDDFLS